MVDSIYYKLIDIIELSNLEKINRIFKLILGSL